jgi:mono/diheme cytochrome c family protein
VFRHSILLLLSFFIAKSAHSAGIYSSERKLDIESLKKNYTVKELSTFNIYTNRVESYKGFDFKEILRDLYGPHWDQTFAYAIRCDNGYESHIETYKFVERKPLLAFARSDQKNFNSILDIKSKIMNLGPLHLVWKETYKKKSKEYAAPRRHHWPIGVVSIRKIENLPLQLLPNIPEDANIWGMRNYFKQCIHCHKVHGIGGTLSTSLTKNQEWKKKGKEWLYKYISNPTSINPKAKMDPFPIKIDLRKKRINDIISYMYDITSGSPANTNVQKVRSKTKKVETKPRSRRARSKKLQELLDRNRL